MRRLLRYPLLVLLFLPGYLGCQTRPDPSSSSIDAKAPGPDTTFYQEASWSPDGFKLLLSRMDIHDAYRASIAVINADGSGYARLTTGPGDVWTSWSPDGTQIAYTSSKAKNRDIYLMQADGSQPIRLTADPAEDTHPDWSPDGTQMVFVSKREGLSQLYVMKSDGSELTKITDHVAEKWNPRWSPDGQRIVYYGAVEQGKDSVYVMNADGSGHRTLRAGIWPSWSHDGSRILFVQDKDLYEMPADGTNQSKLLEDVVIGRWSPDGTKLAFIRVTWRDPKGWPATSDLFIANADGSEAVNVTGK